MIELAMSASPTIRKVLTVAMALAILLWAEAGLALVAGDRVMACHAMMLQGQAGTMAAADASDTQDSDAMPCCPSDSKRVPVLSADGRPCCSVSNDAEQPLGFLVSSERTTAHLLDAGVAIAGGVIYLPAQAYRNLSGVDAPRFVKPILELKTDLRI
jgi:hypothetical protein